MCVCEKDRSFTEVAGVCVCVCVCVPVCVRGQSGVKEAIRTSARHWKEVRVLIECVTISHHQVVSQDLRIRTCLSDDLQLFRVVGILSDSSTMTNFWIAWGMVVILFLFFVTWRDATRDVKKSRLETLWPAEELFPFIYPTQGDIVYTHRHHMCYEGIFPSVSFYMFIHTHVFMHNVLDKVISLIFRIQLPVGFPAIYQSFKHVSSLLAVHKSL